MTITDTNILVTKDDGLYTLLAELPRVYMLLDRRIAIIAL